MTAHSIIAYLLLVAGYLYVGTRFGLLCWRQAKETYGGALDDAASYNPLPIVVTLFVVSVAWPVCIALSATIDPWRTQFWTGVRWAISALLFRIRAATVGIPPTIEFVAVRPDGSEYVVSLPVAEPRWYQFWYRRRWRNAVRFAEEMDRILVEEV